MKKTVTEQNYEMWVTRARNGQLIRVYQINNFQVNPRETERDPLTIPICVDYMTYSEPLADILEERDNLKAKVIRLESNNSVRDDHRLDRLEDKIFPKQEYKPKKWWMFWRKF